MVVDRLTRANMIGILEIITENIPLPERLRDWLEKE